MTTAAQETQVTELLRSRGVRPTRQRVELLAALAEEPNDVTAQSLWRRLREERGSSVGLATVYRTLSLLREQEVVDALTHHGDEVCYRLCSESHHHHLVCRRCHRVVELDGCDLDAWVADAAAVHGFTATAHHLEVEGECARCAAS